MKTTLAIFLVASLAYSSCTVNSSTTIPEDDYERGKFSRLLSYSISYRPPIGDSDGVFSVKLTNKTDLDLLIEANIDAFHAPFFVTPENGETYRLYEQDYQRMRMIAALGAEATNELRARDSLEWIVPLSCLTTYLDDVPTHESLAGCTIVSTMPVTIVVREPGIACHGCNAMQRSNVLKFPSNRGFLSQFTEQISESLF